MTGGHGRLSTKTCKACKRDLPTTDFEHYKTGALRKTCVACVTAIRAKNESDYRGYLSRTCTRLKSQRRKTHEWDVTPEDLWALWEAQGGKCAFSGVNMTHHVDGRGTKDFNASIDRINPDLGYTPQNIQLVAYRVNIMRHTLSVDMFWWWVKNIHDTSID